MSEKQLEKLVVVAPGPEFSTYDVWKGVVAGLRANGVKVRGLKFHSRLKYHREATNLMFQAGVMKHKIDNVTAALMAGNDVLADVMRLDPDAVLVVTGGLLDPEVPVILRQRGYPTFVMLTESPYELEVDSHIAKHYTGAFSNEKTCLNQLKCLSGNPNIWYVQHGFNQDIHKPLSGEEELPPEAQDFKADVVMVGTGFTERIKALEAVPWERMGIDLKLFGTWHKLNGTPLEKYWQTPDAHNDMTTGAINNDYLPALYSNAKVCLNIHRTTKYWDCDTTKEEHIDSAYSANPRVFEVMACGGVLVTDHRDELVDLFGGKGMIVFKKPEELAGILQVLLHDDDLRTTLRREAIEAVQPYNYHKKAQVILALMNRCINATVPESESEKEG